MSHALLPSCCLFSVTSQLFITDVVRNRITPVETIKEQCPSSTIDDQCDEIVVRTPEGRLQMSTVDEHLFMSSYFDQFSCRNRKGGIHDIDISPSREFLATGGRNASDVAVYRLPAIEPYFIGHVR